MRHFLLRNEPHFYGLPLDLCGKRIAIDSIVKGLETAHVRPLKRVRTPRAILVTSCYELSQFRAPEKERTQKIKDEEDASSMRYLTT